MHFTFLHPFKLGQQDDAPPPAVVTHAAEHDTSEGSEFLDDALRMEDLQVAPFEECIAAGSPVNLL